MYMVKQQVKSTDQPNISWTTNVATSDTVEVTVSNADGAAPAIFLTLESGDIVGYFSKNVFFLLPGESVTVIFTSKNQIDNLEASLKE